MAHAFKVIPAKPAFGTLKQVVFQSDYLSRKKALRTVCTSQANCGQIKNAKSYKQVNEYNEGFRLKQARNCTILPFNKSNLIINLYSKMDLKYSCPLINGFPCINCSDLMNPSCCINACKGSKTIDNIDKPFNWFHTIDPVGDLFGKTQCGIENYTNYMVFNPASIPISQQVPTSIPDPDPDPEPDPDPDFPTIGPNPGPQPI